MGLGLIIAQDILHAHGGEIELQSAQMKEANSLSGCKNLNPFNKIEIELMTFGWIVQPFILKLTLSSTEANFKDPGGKAGYLYAIKIAYFYQ